MQGWLIEDWLNHFGDYMQRNACDKVYSCIYSKRWKRLTFYKLGSPIGRGYVRYLGGGIAHHDFGIKVLKKTFVYFNEQQILASICKYLEKRKSNHGNSKEKSN